MGFLNRLTNWWNTTGAKVYNGIKNGVSTGYHAVRNIAHKVGDVASGIDNLLNRDYWIFHPFPQRTFVANLKYVH
jgi:hypothetical protein